MKSKYKIILLCIAIVLALLLFVFLRPSHHKKITLPAVSVRVQHPLQKNRSQTVHTTGYLTANQSTNITPQVSGYIRAIYFKEGQQVNAGQVLFQLNNRLQQDALNSTTSTENLSKLQLAREKQLFAKGYVTHNVYYTAKVTEEQNQAAVQSAQTNLSQRTIVAPFSGTIGARNVSIGDYVNPGTLLTTLVDNQQLKAQYTLPAKNIDQIQLNQITHIQSSTGKNSIDALVSYIAPAIDQATQTLAVHATIHNLKGLFKPGEYVNITQHLGEKQKVLLLPEQCVLASINGYSVFLDKNNKAIRTPVMIGDRTQGNVIIQSGITAADWVVTAGQNELKNNQAIRVTP